LLVPAGRLDEARRLLEPFRSIEDSEVDPILQAEALAELGRVLVLAGDLDAAGPLLEDALTTLELHEAWPALAGALISGTVYLFNRRRREEAVGVLLQALSIAEQHGLTAVALRARFNLAAHSLERDRLTDAVDEVITGLALSRERGDRVWERQMLAQLIAPLVMLGRWDESVSVGATLLDGHPDPDATTAAAFVGRVATMPRSSAAALGSSRRDASYVDIRVSAALVLARDAVERGAADEALRFAADALHVPNTASEFKEEAYALSIEAASEAADQGAIAGLIAFVDALPPALAPPLLRAGRARLEAEKAHRTGDDQAAQRAEDEAIALLRSVGARPLLARALLERAGRRDDPEALEEARRIYSELGAIRWLAALDERRGLTASVR
jgi:tetratricopeptide (TPR) repeat protein